MAVSDGAQKAFESSVDLCTGLDMGKFRQRRIYLCHQRIITDFLFLAEARGVDHGDLPVAIVSISVIDTSSEAPNEIIFGRE